MFTKPGIVSSLLFLPTAALAQQPGPYRDWADWPGPWHMMGWGFGWIFPILMMVVFAFCIFFMIRMFAGHGHHPMHRDSSRSALEILSERFARGEISKEEFEEKRSVLERRQ